MPIRRICGCNGVISIVFRYYMQSVLIGSEYPVMDTLHFYFPQSSYRKAFRGVAECYAFSCFHDNVGLRDLPAIRHIKGTDAVVVNNDTLVGNAILLFSVVHLDVVDQLRNHALCNGGRIRVPPYRCLLYTSPSPRDRG